MTSFFPAILGQSVNVIPSCPRFYREPINDMQDVILCFNIELFVVRRVLDVASYPTVSSRFDNRTALLNIKGVYDEGYYKDARTSKSYIDSPVTISFLGSINQDRSDELLSSSDDVRVWKWTLGYSETLFGQSAASPRNGLSTWLYIAGTIILIPIHYTKQVGSVSEIAPE
ncbi:hypothetical protein P885DRAFT_63957 [Corynascus similis CBS 632.67]